MLRFYRQFMEQILMVLIYARDMKGDNFNGIHDYLRERWRNEDRTRNQWHEPQIIRTLSLIHENDQMEHSLTGLINELHQQLRQTYGISRGPQDKDLIDAIVRSIQLPYARNRLSGEVLDRLKQALLLPSEVVGLKERLQREELICPGCDHKFLEGEIGTISIGRNSRTVSLQCTNCAAPNLMACSNSKHSIPTPASVMKAIAKEVDKGCGFCKAEAEAEITAANVGLPLPLEGGMVPPDTVGIAAQPQRVTITPMRTRLFAEEGPIPITQWIDTPGQFFQATTPANPVAPPLTYDLVRQRFTTAPVGTEEVLPDNAGLADELDNDDNDERDDYGEEE